MAEFLNNFSSLVSLALFCITLDMKLDIASAKKVVSRQKTFLASKR